jgi:hypothetical protein
MYVTPTGTASITGGTIAVDDGTASVPSIAFASDADGTGTGIYRRAANVFSISSNGGGHWEVNSNFIHVPSDGIYAWGSGAIGTSNDTFISRATANSLQFGGASGATAAATSRTEINKAVGSFTNAAAKATFTITVPNAAHSASFLVRVTGSLGAGGAIGANEATATNSYVVAVTRTSGVNATVAISAAFGAAATAVAGAATVTCVAAMSAVTGAVGATNTFTVDVTISRSGGSSDNHTCLCYAQLLNANSTGVTIA